VDEAIGLRLRPRQRTLPAGLEFVANNTGYPGGTDVGETKVVEAFIGHELDEAIPILQGTVDAESRHATTTGALQP
jgi:hypothetical protein